MINSIKQFFADLKATSKYLWYLVKFLLYVFGIWISFTLLNLASTVAFVLGFLLFASVIIICAIRSTRVIKSWIKRFGE